MGGEGEAFEGIHSKMWSVWESYSEEGTVRPGAGRFFSNRPQDTPQTGQKNEANGVCYPMTSDENSSRPSVSVEVRERLMGQRHGTEGGEDKNSNAVVGRNGPPISQDGMSLDHNSLVNANKIQRRYQLILLRPRVAQVFGGCWGFR